MASLGFTGIGSGLLTLLVLALWVLFWFVGPVITFLGLAMSGGGGKKAAQGRVLYSAVFLTCALAGAAALWVLTSGDWPLRIVFAVAPAGAWFWMTARAGKDAAGKRAQADAIYAQAKARQQQVTREARESAAADAHQLAQDKTARPDVVSPETNLTDLLLGNAKGKPPSQP